jgi:hypothetical protein
VKTTNKVFRLSAGQIKPLAVGYGSCIATDEITVDGKLIGYCYREHSDDEIDTGWRFFSGEESEENLDDTRNFEIYDINTIANYDQEIVVIINAPVGTAFQRGEDGRFVQID